MPPITPPGSTAELLALVRGSGIYQPGPLDDRLAAVPALPPDPLRAAEVLVRQGVLTRFQAKQLLAGRHKGFRLGPYIIRDLLGQGGMGAVYLAEHETLRRRTALKVLPPQQGPDHKVSVERFLREARAAAALDHPNIVRIHDIAQQGEIHYIGLEYVEGQTLDQLLTKGGPVTPSLAVGYIAQAAAGLQHAHEKGFVHRDIKPANLILTRDGTIKIVDMGLARSFAAGTDKLTELFDKGAVVGTADYIAPEQALGDPGVDIRADIYSLGATFYALVTGKPPFEGSTSQKLAQHQMKPPPDLTARDRTFPPELARVAAKMLAKKPADRFQTPAEVVAALAPWLSDDGGQKVVIGLSGTDQGSSGRLQETLDEIVSQRTKRTGLKRPAVTAPARRPRGQLIAAAAAAVALLLGVIGYAAWPTAKPTETSLAPTTPPTPAAPTSTGPTPPPDDAGAAVASALPVPRATPKVVIKSGIDGLYVQTPRYEAVVDKADGCLSSFRVGGVEFLRNGAPLAGGRTTARGGYFYSEKNGHQGLVKLTDVQQPAPNLIVATGGSFTVRYECGPTALTVTAQNATDDTVPYYLILDSAAVSDVVDDKGEQQAVPVARTQGDPLDPRWRTTTWVAGRARLKLTDQTADATTRIWGPYSDFQSQVWESDAKTYNHVQFTLEPSLGAELPRPVLTPGGVLMTRAGPSRRIQTELYDATVDADSCMPSLRIAGVEVLRANIDVSRGAYFLPGFKLPPFEIKQPAPTTIDAQSDKAAIRYDFGPDKMTWTVENRSDQGMPFFIVMDTTVAAVRNDKGEWAKTPAHSTDVVDPKWAATTWFAGRAKFKLTGGTRVWGPWQDRYQVWEASLAPKEKRVVAVELGLTDAAEAARIGDLTGVKPALATELMLDAPTDYQVFQRKTKLQGAITVAGRVRAAYDRLEVRTVGKSLQGPLPDDWREVALEDKGRSFEAAVPTPAGGWYKVEVRALKGGAEVGRMAVDHVGVGEVFVGAGQSNSTNCGQERTKQTSGMVAAFSGTGWQLADDPLPGVHDNSGGGSYWPAFGDALYAEYQVPIGVASTGHSGTSVNQWAPGGELCRWTTGRMAQLGRGGFRAVLWHQGESDVGMPAEEYARKMTGLIQETRRSAGWEVPWFVAQVSYHNPNQVSFPTTRAAQKKLWETGVAFEGPDTDTLTGDNRDEGGRGIHFSPKGLRAHGKMWAEKVGIHLDKELAR